MNTKIISLPLIITFAGCFESKKLSEDFCLLVDECEESHNIELRNCVEGYNDYRKEMRKARCSEEYDKLMQCQSNMSCDELEDKLGSIEAGEPCLEESYCANYCLSESGHGSGLVAVIWPEHLEENICQ